MGPLDFTRTDYTAALEALRSLCKTDGQAEFWLRLAAVVARRQHEVHPRTPVLTVALGSRDAELSFLVKSRLAAAFGLPEFRDNGDGKLPTVASLILVSMRTDRTGWHLRRLVRTIARENRTVANSVILIHFPCDPARLAGTTGRDREERSRRSGGLSEATLDVLDVVWALRPWGEQNRLAESWTLAAKPSATRQAPTARVSGDAAIYLESAHILSGWDDTLEARRRLLERELESGQIVGMGNFDLAGGVAVPRSLERRALFWNEQIFDARSRFEVHYQGNSRQTDFIFQRITRSSMHRGSRDPVGVFLLAGPTGAGKTFLGQTLALAFGKGPPLIIEGTQLREGHRVAATLFGAPPGFRNCELGGGLTRPLLRRLDQVVIFENFDKAHESFLPLITHAIGAGETHEPGTQSRVDLSHAVFFLTTTLFEREMAELAQMNFSPERMAEEAGIVFSEAGLLDGRGLACIHGILPLAPDPACIGLLLKRVSTALRVAPDHEVRQEAVAAAEAAIPGGARLAMRAIERTILAQTGG
jgi:hypothetical protein